MPSANCYKIGQAVFIGSDDVMQATTRDLYHVTNCQVMEEISNDVPGGRLMK